MKKRITTEDSYKFFLNKLSQEPKMFELDLKELLTESKKLNKFKNVFKDQKVTDLAIITN